MKLKPTQNKAVALIAVVIIITLSSIIALGIVTYITNILSLNLATIDQGKAFYAAQAGIMSAIVDYQNNGSITAETDIQMSNDTYYSTGGAGMFFLADATNPSIVANRKLKDTPMTNLNSVDDATITHMQVSWDPDGGENLSGIDLGRATAEWTGLAPSGTNIDIIDFTIPAGTTENDVWLDWELGTDISSMTIIVVLTFSDESTVEIVLLNAGQAGDNAIVLTSTGKVTTAHTWKRTIKASYDPAVNEIISWEESQDHL